jgi:hypothetical protein
MLNDEEAFIWIEAIEIVTEILENFPLDIVEKDYVSAILNIMEI